jgi:hypothetical protein
MPKADDVIEYLIALLVPPGASRDSAIQHLNTLSGSQVVQAILDHKRSGTDVRGRVLSND